MTVRNQAIGSSLMISLATLLFFVGCHAPPSAKKASQGAAGAANEAGKDFGPNCNSEKAIAAAVDSFEEKFKVPREEIQVADIALRAKVQSKNSEIAVRQIAIIYSKNPGKSVHNVYVREDRCEVTTRHETQFVTTDSDMANELPCNFKNQATSNQSLAMQTYSSGSSPYEIDSRKALFELYKASNESLTLVLIPKDNCAAAQSFERALNPAPEKVQIEASKK